MKQRKNTNRGLKLTVACLSVVLALLLAACAGLELLKPDTSASTNPTGTSGSTAPTTVPTAPTTLPTTAPTTAPTEPPIFKLSTATLAATGDVLMHSPIISHAVRNEDGTYNFDNAFTYFRDYVLEADYAIANLETTLAGTYRPYAGYPQFNSPDGIAVSLQNAGFDMLLTANNHTYDTFDTGFFRTQQVLQELGMDYLGTVDSTDDKLWQVHDINGIKVGMICYTYETDSNPSVTALNGITMSKKAADLIGTFHSVWGSHDLEPFYAAMEQNIREMKEAGAEAIVLYIHWGYEYQTTQSSTQSAIAQKMCDMGVDVIVGGHPHVLQPMELLTSTTDENHKTVCLYSTGNILSNQRIEYMDLKTGHTEDGILFNFTFAKYSDGTVILESADVLPAWVDLHYDDAIDKMVYSILPLDKGISDWKAAFDLTDTRLANAQKSYDRTMAIVGAGLADVQAYLAQLVADTEASLGIG